MPEAFELPEATVIPPVFSVVTPVLKRTTPEGPPPAAEPDATATLPVAPHADVPELKIRLPDGILTAALRV